jgi:diacylglycerol kinase (ATP)
MQKDKRFSFSDRLRSFRYAFRGILELLKNEHNFRIHVVILIFVIIAGIGFSISSSEWLAVIFVSALVLAAEAFNSSIEQIASKISPGHDEAIGKAKDLAAAAVLISAIASGITGLIIFLPHLLTLFE